MVSNVEESSFKTVKSCEITVESKIGHGSTFTIKLPKLRNDGMNTSDRFI